MWTWLQTIPSGAASFLGSLIGASVGLVALLIGALFNAHLNRRRDDRLRKEDSKSLVVALRAELAALHESLSSDLRALNSITGDFGVRDLAYRARIFPEMLDKLVLLDDRAITAVMEAYLCVDRYYEQLMVFGEAEFETRLSPRRMVRMKKEKVSIAIEHNEKLASYIGEALVELDRLLKEY